jgi:hypothetical protein
VEFDEIAIDKRTSEFAERISRIWQRPSDIAGEVGN